MVHNGFEVNARNMSALVLIGNIVHYSEDGFVAFSGHLAVENGKITSIGRTKNIENISQNLGLTKYVLTELKPHQFIMPGMIDCHLHAPQFPNIGLGMDKSLLDWLSIYTFPLEKKYDNPAFAQSVYSTVVNRTLKNGTTTACYYGSLHYTGSTILADVAKSRGQRALIGKVSMTMFNDIGYFNTAEKELEETEKFIKYVRDMGSDLIEPVITPRFALSCDEAVMKKLAALAQKYNCRIQSHISENQDEVLAVKNMYPGQKTYADVYDNANLLTDKCIMAHGVHLEDSEMDLFAKKGVSIAHCPASNTRLKSGLCPVRKLQQKRVVVGLGTDVSGGDSSSILDAMRRCMDVSINKVLENKEYGAKFEPISWIEAFYLATMGGAKGSTLSLEDRVGNFDIEKEFDALIIDNFCKDSSIDKYDMPETSENEQKEDEIRELVQQFIYLGNDKNISKVFVRGKEITF